MMPADLDVRVLLQRELEATLLVEAGAGTGKTRELVGRVVRLVAAGLVRMEELAAITFTEAAAAELRDRIRQGLEQASRDRTLAPDERERCAQAAHEVDQAAIQTIHAFAGLLLRSFPLEAGLPPGFTIWDQITRDLAFDERFRAWLYDEVPHEDGSGRCAAVRRALALGLKSNQLRQLAAALQDHYDLLERGTPRSATPPPDTVAVARQHGTALQQLQELLPLALDGERDPLVQEIQAVQLVARQLAEARDEEAALLALQRLVARAPRLNLGKQQRWQADAAGNPVPRIRAVFRAARDAAEETLQHHRRAALEELLRHLAAFTLDYAAERRRQGVATFHDLLVWARDLLRDRPEVRRRAHARFRRIFIDEFQDTDPLQAEIAWLLAADPAQAEERDWRQLQPAPGRLFLVGDPKQSIYRFRRADIGLYGWIADRLAEAGNRVVELWQNFRSSAAVVTWVNHHFSQILEHQPGVQVAFRPLEPRPFSVDGADEPTWGVYRLGRPLDGGAADVAAAEARAVARLAHRVVAEGWPVSEIGDGTLRVRQASYRDICILMPTRTHLRRLERALQREEVPFRVESGSLVLGTMEVRDLLSCLRAIDDPSDQVALVAALRSPAYACSDADLLAWVEAGRPLDYLAGAAVQPCGDDTGPVAAALASLRRFHDQRLERSAAETVEAFIRERMLAVQAFGRPRPREAWRRLRYVVAQARALAVRGQPSLRALLDWLERLQDLTFYDAESPVPESDEDAVRLLTVHGAKGLEFPIVILTGLGRRVGGRGTSGVTLTRSADGCLEVRCGKQFQTSGFDPEREEALVTAEDARLLYVAATRARDHLVLSLYHPQKHNDCHAARMLRLLEDPGAPRCVPLTEDGPMARPAIADAMATVEELAAEEHARREQVWRDQRAALVRRLGVERTAVPSHLAERCEPRTLVTPREVEADAASPLDEERATPRPLRPGRGATALGRAVHAVLQHMDLATLAGLEPLAARAAVEYEVEGQQEMVIRYARAAVTSPAVHRALETGRCWREVPVGIPIPGGVLEGAIDLLYEYPDGTLGVIDYKTDQAEAPTSATRLAHYRVQCGAYALAVEQVSGRQVSSIELVFAALGGQCLRFERAEVEALMAEARAILDPETPAGDGGIASA